MSEDGDDLTGSDATVREGQRPLVRGEGDAARLERGAQIGRYIVIEEIGAGGMGVVYAAFDPELDRRVAIKLLNMRARANDQSWLVREAQALARLSHPNVVSVFDVGTLPGDRVFVAMELVQGDTLRDWLRTPEPRPWREVLAIGVQAGRGLAAAHASGLVHRDFKPDNVLVGADGRVRVMDFGLARLSHVPEEHKAATRESDLSIEVRSPLSMSLTVVGEVFGTPAYMAPEIYAGVPAGPRSDQFSFGVTMFEALYGARPFGRRKQDEPLPAPTMPPNMPVVPVKLHKAVMRAIAADPEARFASMDEMLAEIAVDPEAARRRLVVGLGLSIGLAGIAIGAVSMTREKATAVAEAPALCTHIEQRLAGIWDDGKRAEVKKSFEATNSPFTAMQWPAVDRMLGAYAKEWVKVATESCRATRITGEQSAEVMDLRQACLDQRLFGLQAQVGLFAQADTNIVEKADSIAAGLESLQRCSDIAALRAPMKPSPEVAAKLKDMEPKIAKANVQLAAGQYLALLGALPELAESAKSIGYDPLTAAVQVTRGQLLLTLGKHEEAMAAMSEATWAALRGRRDDLAATAALSAAQVAAMDGKTGEADVWLGLGSVAVSRIRVATLDNLRLKVLGVVAGERGDMVTAVKAHEEALEGTPDDPILRWLAHQVLAATLAKHGAWARAVEHYEKALAIREQAVGKDHPDIALVLSALGAGYDHAGKADKAKEALDRALAIREKAFGADNPRLVVPLNNLADHHKKGKRYADALALIERARVLADRAIPKGHPTYHIVATTHAEILHAAGKRAEARRAFDRVQALEVEARSPVLATTLASRAALELDEKRYKPAVQLALESIAGFEAAGGTASPELWRPLTTLGAAKLALKDSAGARGAFERAIEVGMKARVAESDLAPARDYLAKLPKPPAER